MPFYLYKAEDGQEIEKMFSIKDRPDEIIEEGKLYKRVEEFSTNFILKGGGWAGKGSATAPSVKKGKEFGIAVDTEKKNQMKRDGEI